MQADGYADNDGVRIHYVRTGEISSGGTTVVVIPGMTESAEDYARYFKGFPIGDAVFISIRGRGRSDAPERGYSFEEQVSDIDAVLEHLEVRHCVIVGFSVGASFALAYTLQRPERVRGLGIIDYAPHYPSIPERWIGDVTQPGRELLPVRVARAIVEEGERVVLSRDLSQIGCPVLVVRGGAEGSLLPEEIARLYMERIPRCTMLVLDDMGHDPFAASGDRFLSALVALADSGGGAHDASAAS